MDEHNDSDEPARFPFDAIYKALCCHRQTIENILTGYLAEPIGPLPTAWIDSLDFDGLRKLSTEWVTREFRMRRGDQVWEVPFKAQAQAEGYPRFLLLNLEFQSRRDGFMALRFLDYGNELYREVRAQGVVGEGDPCPAVRTPAQRTLAVDCAHVGGRDTIYAGRAWSCSRAARPRSVPPVGVLPTRLRRAT